MPVSRLSSWMALRRHCCTRYAQAPSLSIQITSTVTGGQLFVPFVDTRNQLTLRPIGFSQLLILATSDLTPAANSSGKLPTTSAAAVTTDDIDVGHGLEQCAPAR